MGKFFSYFLTLAFLTNLAFAQENDELQPLTLSNKHQIGIRLGTWVNSGEKPPLLLVDTIDNTSLATSVKDASFYFEGYFAYSLIPHTYVELSLGLVNRGSVTLQENNNTDIGNLLLYPILLQLKLYPIGSFNSKFQPYVTIGGGLYYGKRNVQFTNNRFSFFKFNEDTETDFNYTLSGGADWLLNNSLALDFNIKYMPINFSKSLVTISDYDAVAITVGIKYLYAKNKK
ncbi:MAG: OmpW family outer membrane protein [Candidatus Zixiibacteriota bacterium]